MLIYTPEKRKILSLQHGMKSQRRSRGTSELDAWVINTMPGPFLNQKKPHTLCTEGWVGTKASLEGRGKSYSHLGSNPISLTP
jgi:hypothetical protein